jgi:hypothetical protein
MESARTPPARKTYQSPALKKLTPKEAKQFLLRQANLGETGAKDILNLVLPCSSNSK